VSFLRTGEELSLCNLYCGTDALGYALPECKLPKSRFLRGHGLGFDEKALVAYHERLGDSAASIRLICLTCKQK